MKADISARDLDFKKHTTARAERAGRKVFYRNKTRGPLPQTRGPLPQRQTSYSKSLQISRGKSTAKPTSLEEKFLEIQRQNAIYKDQIEFLSQELNIFIEVVDPTKEQNSFQSTETNTSLHILRSTLTTSQQQKQLQVCRDMVAALKSDVSYAKQREAAVEEQLGKMKSQLDEKEQTIIRMAKKEDVNDRKFVELQKLNQNLIQDRDSCIETSKTLNVTCEKLQATLKATQARLVQSKVELENLQKKEKEDCIKREEFQAETANLRSEIQLLRQKEKTARTSLSTYEAKFQVFQNKVAELQREKTMLRKQLDAIKSEKAEQQKENPANFELAMNKLSGFETTISMLQHQSVELRKTDQEKHHKAMKEREIKIDKLVKTETDLFQELQSLVKIADEKEQALKKAILERNQFSEENKRLQEVIVILRKSSQSESVFRSQITKLENQNLKLRDDIGALEQKLKVEREKQMSTKTVKQGSSTKSVTDRQLVLKLNEANKQMADSKSLIVRLKSENKAVRLRNQHLEEVSKLKTSQKTKQRDTTETNETQSLRERLQWAKTELQKQDASNSALIETLRKEKDRLAAELQRVQNIANDNANKEAAETNFRKTISKLESQLLRLQEELTRQLQINGKLNVYLLELKKKVEVSPVYDEVNRFNEDIRATDDRNRLWNENEKLRSTLQQLNGSSLAFRNKTISELQLLRETVRCLEEEKHSMNEMIRKRDEETEKYKSEFESRLKEAHALTAEVQTAKDTLGAEAKQRIAREQQLRQELTDQLNESQAQIKSLNDDKAALKSEYQALKSRLDQDASRSLNEITKLKEEVKRYQEDIEKSYSDVLRFTKDVKRIAREKVFLGSQNPQLSGERPNLSEEYSNYSALQNAELEKCKQTIIEMNYSNTELQSQIKQLTVQLDKLVITEPPLADANFTEMDQEITLDKTAAKTPVTPVAMPETYQTDANFQDPTQEANNLFVKLRETEQQLNKTRCNLQETMKQLQVIEAKSRKTEEEKKQLAVEVSKHQQTISGLKLDNSSLVEKSESCEKDVATLSVTVEELKKQLSIFETRKVSLQQEHDVTVAANVQMQVELNEINVQVSKLVQEKSRYEKDVEALKQERVAQESSFRLEMEENIKQLQVENVRLQTSVTSISKDKEDLIKQNLNLSSLIEMVKESHENTQNTLMKEMSDIRHELQRTGKNLDDKATQGRIVQLGKIETTLNERIETLEQEASNAKLSHDRTVQELNYLRIQNTQLSSQLTDVEAELKILSYFKANLEEKVALFSDQINEQNETIVKLEAEKRQLEYKVQSSEEEHKRVSSDKSENETSTHGSADDRGPQQFPSRIEDGAEDDDIAERVRALEQIHQHEEHQEHDVAILQRELDQTKSDYELLNKKNSELKTKKHEYKMRLLETQRQIEEFKIRLASVDEQRQFLELENKKLRTGSKDDLSVENEALKREVDELGEKLRIEQVEREITTSNLKRELEVQIALSQDKATTNNYVVNISQETKQTSNTINYDVDIENEQQSISVENTLLREKAMEDKFVQWTTAVEEKPVRELSELRLSKFKLEYEVRRLERDVTVYSQRLKTSGEPEEKKCPVCDEVEKENASLLEEVMKLRAKQDYFDEYVLDDVEDIRHNYSEAVEMNVRYEEQLRAFSEKYGFHVNLPVNDDE